MNILLWIAYKGTRYGGFQVQPNAPTICQTLQDAMQEVLRQRPDVKGCSRTDAGVHAREFALSFRYEGKMPPQKMTAALNAKLPPDIRALRVQQVPEEFHARYAAHAKTYSYSILNAAVDDPFTWETCCRISPHLDEAAMQEAANLLVGRHDFAAFCASGSSVLAKGGDTTRTVTRCTVQREGERVTVTVTADGYLYNMVRILAGTLVQVGLGKMCPADITDILQSKDRRRAGQTMPAKGLTLERVDYPPEALYIPKEKQ